MKRAVLAVGVAVFLAAPAAAQWLGQPIWNSPMGATGITIYGDYGKPNTDAGQGSAVGGRVALASGSVTLTPVRPDRKSTRLNSSHRTISYAVFCLKKKKKKKYKIYFIKKINKKK